MNTHSLLVLLPVLALGACSQPESSTATTPAAPAAETAVTAVATAEVAVNQTVVLAITGAS